MRGKLGFFYLRRLLDRNVRIVAIIPDFRISITPISGVQWWRDGSESVAPAGHARPPPPPRHLATS